MNKEKLGQKPAFACANDGGINEGMSKRFYAACAAMQGLLANQEVNKSNYYNNEILVGVSYSIADELLKQENQ